VEGNIDLKIKTTIKKTKDLTLKYFCTVICGGKIYNFYFRIITLTCRPDWSKWPTCMPSLKMLSIKKDIFLRNVLSKCCSPDANNFKTVFESSVSLLVPEIWRLTNFHNSFAWSLVLARGSKTYQGFSPPMPSFMVKMTWRLEKWPPFMPSVKSIWSQKTTFPGEKAYSKVVALVLTSSNFSLNPLRAFWFARQTIFPFESLLQWDPTWDLFKYEPWWAF